MQVNPVQALQFNFSILKYIVFLAFCVSAIP
jgi:hypothetical protein